jgi:hypothetical protein
MSEQTASPKTNPANKDFIRYPRFKELHAEIRRCQELSKCSSEPQCMSLEGSSGAGKTTLLRDYADLFPTYEGEEGQVIPVFYAEIPSPATVKSVVASLLEQLGDPGANKGTTWAMTSRLIGLIRDCGVELVILDEFSNLIDTDTNHILNTVSDWLKMVIKKSNVPFLVVGITGKVERILNANAQLSRLFAYRETLQPFLWGNKDTIAEFALFLQYSERVVGMELCKEVPKAELYYRIHYSTDGVVGNVMNLLRYAGLVAQERNASVIELADLSAAFNCRIGKHLRNKINPFVFPADAKFIPPQNGNDDDQSPSVNTTLTTR